MHVRMLLTRLHKKEEDSKLAIRKSIGLSRVTIGPVTKKGRLNFGGLFFAFDELALTAECACRHSGLIAIELQS